MLYHPRRQIHHVGQVLIGLLLLMSALSGCQLQRQPQPAELSIKIDSPASGMEMGVEEVAIQSTATGPRGISWIELWVDGELVETTQAPTPLQPKFSAVQHWQATTPGEHLIEVRTYDEKGTASRPATIVLRVRSEEAAPMPTPALQEGRVVPTATPLPTAFLPTPTPTISICERNSKFVKDVTVPDNTEFAPGTEFEKTWRVRNTGTCSWGPDYELIFVKGEQMGGPDRIAVPATNPEEETDLSVTLVAPDKPGTYRGDWRLRAPYGELFGSQLYVKIIVVAPTATPALSASAVPTATSPAMVTATPAASE